MYRKGLRAGQPSRSPDQCEHLLAAAPRDVGSPAGCQDHQDGDGPVVHLRVCLECGHVGCCDSSVARHATAHAAGTGHPVVQSGEPGETWRWCYQDDILG
jgi:hypothetical protein